MTKIILLQNQKEMLEFWNWRLSYYPVEAALVYLYEENRFILLEPQYKEIECLIQFQAFSDFMKGGFD